MPSGGIAIMFFRTGNTTNIYKFKLEENDVLYKGRSKVPGYILNQFSMDEHNDNFRIATTDTSISPRANKLYILDSQMDIIGKLEDIAPGESIYSVRFMGDKAYMVTFVKVDPFFVLDLSEPEKPKI